MAGVLAWMPSVDALAAKISISDVEAVVYPQLLLRADLTTRRGYREVLSEPGMMYVALWARVKVKWDEDSPRVHVPVGQMKLVAYDGAKSEPIGRMERYGIFSTDALAFGRFRPLDWKKRANEMFIFNTVFAVPQGRTSFEFQLGSARKKVKLPRQRASMNPASYVDFRLLNVGYKNALPEVAARDGSETHAMGERFLTITVSMRPSRSNGGPRRTFEWETDWMAVRDLQGGVHAPVGVVQNGIWSNPHEHQIAAIGPKKWDREKVTLYFVVGAENRDYEVLFLGYPVLSTVHGASDEEAEAKPSGLDGRRLWRR